MHPRHAPVHWTGVRAGTFAGSNELQAEGLQHIKNDTNDAKKPFLIKHTQHCNKMYLAVSITRLPVSFFQNLTFKYSNESNSSECQWLAWQRAGQVRPVSASCRRKAADPWRVRPARGSIPINSAPSR